MASTILVTGATGKLGQRVVSRLLQNHAEVRVLTRRREDALKLWGDRVDISEGNFSDPASLKEAARGIDRLFLLSPSERCWRRTRRRSSMPLFPPVCRGS